MNLLPSDDNGCPFLLLAPMEGVGDRCFRKAMAHVGGFDEAVTDFVRVPTNAHVQSLSKVYNPTELAPIPLAVQLMGSDEELMAAMALEMQKRGALRIDLNCGCPSNKVTGRGAGSSLLKDPEAIYAVLQAMVKAVNIPVTIKMRAGYEDTSLFKENLLAAEKAGASYITLHPRTKVDGYTPPARWELIAEAKATVRIPIVGNGDILSVEDALAMQKQTGCDALMIGRGSVINPFIFRQIRAYFAKKELALSWQDRLSFVRVYVSMIPDDAREKLKINKLKQLMGFLFKATPELMDKRAQVLTSRYTKLQDFLDFSYALLREGCSL